jgi:hypothetical protein
MIVFAVKDRCDFLGTNLLIEPEILSYIYSTYMASLLVKISIEKESTSATQEIMA